MMSNQLESLDPMNSILSDELQKMELVGIQCCVQCIAEILTSTYHS